ncbi:MAG: hypothetical protein DLM67_20565 [Candidatus Nephthysia bennettiae]|uniref:MFS transporter n=1 Tax=Candidatus Nephthysia bennettiae TaxID=3127016 RepID=A0A934K850_9BACT|nr:MFS transporter [Candidatus Dormibacteraeota bacterium]MBJ7612378.1 MFS transporter [Candidatus Dormibacteraeota bacterium]PZR88444.1 MAG: hypothetical protein DLM67_20565 [Candidatus Dormibacteraeota bacterium]
MVAALGAGLIVGQGATLYLFSLLLVPMQKELGWSRAELSGAYAMSSLVLGLAGLPVGRLIDRSGPRAPWMTGAALGALCLLAVSLIHQPWQFYLFWGLGLGVAGALMSLQVASTTVANWFFRRRGRALAILTVLVGLTAPLYVPAASWLITHLGWREAVAILAIAFVAVPLPLGLLLRRRPEDVGLRPDGDPAPVGGTEKSPDLDAFAFREAMRSPAFWTLTISTLFSATALGAVTAHQVAHMIGRGTDPNVAASLIGVLGLLSIPGRFFFIAATDWLGARRMLVSVIGIQTVGLVILTLGHSTAWFLAYSIVYGAAAGSAFGVRASMMAAMFGRRAFGSISAVFQLFVYVGTAIGPIGAGLLYDRLHSYDVAFTIATLMTGATIAGLLLIPRTRLERRQEVPT